MVRQEWIREWRNTLIEAKGREERENRMGALWRGTRKEISSEM